MPKTKLYTLTEVGKERIIRAQAEKHLSNQALMDEAYCGETTFYSMLRLNPVSLQMILKIFIALDIEDAQIGVHYEHVPSSSSEARVSDGHGNNASPDTGEPVPVTPRFPLPYEPQCFQGREQDLQTLRDNFLGGKHRQAVSALGGMGKTYLALEYARRFTNEYKPIFWVQAGMEESVRSRYAESAGLLGLIKNETRTPTQANPQTEAEAAVRKQAEQAKAIAAFLNWLDSHSNWLLVMDNADALEFLSKYLPRNPQGHILLTTRAHNLSHLNIHAPLRLKKLTKEEALQFLLHSCECLEADKDEQKAAADLARELDYLPLALAHAAAYIAHLQTSFAHYLELYGLRKLALLEESQGIPGDPYLISIRATWEMNFRALETERGTGRAGAYAQDLLNFCAFIDADNIPCELALAGAKEYCPPLYDLLAQPQNGKEKTDFCGVEDEKIFHDLLLPLVQYSLITKSRESPPRFNIHRMVQRVIADRLGDQKRDWQDKAIRATDTAYPEPLVRNWPLCERLHPHVLAVGKIIRQEGLTTQASGRLLCHLGEYLMCLGQYEAAEVNARYGLSARELYASEHPLDVAVSLAALGNICHCQNRLDKAQELLERALKIWLQHPVQNHLEITHVRNDLAMVYNSQKLYPKAEEIYLLLLATADTALEANTNPDFHSHKATLCNNLGLSCYRQGRNEEAAQRYNEALEHWTAYNVENNPHHANTWHDLAQAYKRLGRAESEECYFNALKIQRVAYPQGHFLTAVTLYNIADFYKNANRYDEAEEYYQQTVAEEIKVNGEIHSDVVFDLNALLELYRLMGRQADVDAVQQRINAIAQELEKRGQQT